MVDVAYLSPFYGKWIDKSSAARTRQFTATQALSGKICAQVSAGWTPVAGVNYPALTEADACKLAGRDPDYKSGCNYYKALRSGWDLHALLSSEASAVAGQKFCDAGSLSQKNNSQVLVVAIICERIFYLGLEPANIQVLACFEAWLDPGFARKNLDIAPFSQPCRFFSGTQLARNLLELVRKARSNQRVSI